MQSQQQHTNQHNLLLKTRHQMLWTPPSKWPLFTLSATLVSWREKSQKSLKCSSGLQCGCPSDTFSWCRLNRVSSWLIVRAGNRADSDVKRANRRGWQTYITARHRSMSNLSGFLVAMQTWLAFKLTSIPGENTYKQKGWTCDASLVKKIWVLTPWMGYFLSKERQ